MRKFIKFFIQFSQFFKLCWMTAAVSTSHNKALDWPRFHSTSVSQSKSFILWRRDGNRHPAYIFSCQPWGNNCCRRQHTNLHGVTVVPSFFDRVIIIRREISIFISFGGGGGNHFGNIHRTLLVRDLSVSFRLHL